MSAPFSFLSKLKNLARTQILVTSPFTKRSALSLKSKSFNSSNKSQGSQKSSRTVNRVKTELYNYSKSRGFNSKKSQMHNIWSWSSCKTSLCCVITKFKWMCLLGLKNGCRSLEGRISWLTTPWLTQIYIIASTSEREGKTMPMNDPPNSTAPTTS